MSYTLKTISYPYVPSGDCRTLSEAEDASHWLQQYWKLAR